MPRAQDILSGAVLWTSLIILQIVAENFDLKQVTAGHSEITGDFHVFERANFINADWSQEDLVKLRQAMNEHVSQLRVELEEYNFSPRSRRSERTTIRSPSVTGMNRIPRTNLNATASQLEIQGTISCFVWNGESFCILGGTIFVFKKGKAEPFLSGLPIGTNDHVKTHVYDDVIFLTIYNMTSLRLYLLESPGWMTLISIQHITAEVLEDCVFFENQGTLYMALAIQLGTMQYASNAGMQCVIYEWLGTTMDMKHSFPAPQLRKISALQSSDSVHLVLILGNSSIHLRRFTDLEETELLEIIDIDLDHLYQLDAFVMNSQWCLLLAGFSGSTNSFIYCLQDQRLLQWQVLLHNQTFSSVSWMRIQQDGIRDSYESVILIFNAFDSQNQFEFYASDTSGHFTRIFVSPKFPLDGLPVASLALLDEPNSAHLHMITTVANKFFLEGFAIQLSEQFHDEPAMDPLLQCLSDVDFLVSKRDTSAVGHVENFKNNMVHFQDNITINGTLVISQMDYSQTPVIDTVKVLYNFSEEFKKPKELENAMKELELAAKNISMELPSLLYATNSSYTGRLQLNGKVTADEILINRASVRNLNGRVWDDFVRQAWRYSSPQHTIRQDIHIGEVKAENISVGSTVGGSLPSRWLLKTGGEITGRADLATLDVGGNITIKNNVINGVSMSDILKKNSPHVVQGLKIFAAMKIKNNISADSVNERDFRTWAEKLVLQKSEEEQHFTGFVHLKGPVKVVDRFHSDWINGINVSTLPETLVNKNAHQIVTGPVRFTGPLLVDDAEVDSLNNVRIEDLLSKSGQQTINATIDVDVLDVIGNLVTPDINGQDVDDFVYTDEDNVQEVLGRVQFADDLGVKNLKIENGTLNGLEVIKLLNPPSLRIDSQIQANGDLTAHAAHVQVINNVELSKLRNLYWTKSTNQTIDVNVRMPFEVIVKENVTTWTFMDRFLDRDFYKIKANETFNVDVTFKDDVTMHGDLIIHDLKDINGVFLAALDEDVVKKEGEFTILGTKTFEQLTIHGSLKVEETFNNLIVPQDIAFLNQPQTLTGIHFSSDVSADGDVLSSNGNITLKTVAGIVLEDFVASAAMIDEDAVINGNINFKRHLDVEDLVINHLLNGHDVNDIVQNGLRKDNNDGLEWPKLTVHGNLKLMDSIDTNTINGYDVDEYLSQVVDMTNPKNITGKKKTSHPTTVLQNATFNLFNGVPLDFSTMLTASDDQTITGDYTFEHLMAQNIDLLAINGRNLSDFVQTSGTKDVQIITGVVDIEHVTVENSLKIENHVLNGCNLTDYLDVTNFTHFESLSIQNGTLLLDQPAANNPHLATISLKTLRKDRPQVVTGNITLLTDILMDKLNVSDNHLGPVNLNEFLHGTMLKSTEQNVSGTIKYLNGIETDRVEHVGHLKVKNWNGKDVKEMVDQVVLKTGNLTVRAKKTFLGDLDIQGNLQISGYIDGVPVNTLVKTNESQLPPGTKFNSLVVKEQLNVGSGIIDGVNITSMFQQRVPLRGNSTIKSNIVFTNAVTADNISATKINNLNMSEVVLRTMAPGQVITGKKNLIGSMHIEGDINVDLLNGWNPEENAAFIVLKDQDAEFQQGVAFIGGLTVLKDVNVTNYNDQNLNQLLTNASTEIVVPAIEPKTIFERTPALPLLLSLQKSAGKLSSFEFFEQIQQFPFSFTRGSNFSIQIQHCPIPTRKQSSTSDTAAGILVATHSTDGNSCKLKKFCRCHRSITLPSDTNGYVNTLRMPIRLKDYLEEKMVYGDRVRLLHSRDYLFVFSIESLPNCLTEKVTIAVVNPLTFKVLKEIAFELNDTVVDLALEERNSDGVVVLAIGQKSAGVWIYTFDGDTLQSQQLIETEKVASIHLTSHTNTTFLAVASYGLEAISSIWNASDSGKFEYMTEVVTFGATDVIFTKLNDGVFVTFSQDPSSIEAYSDNWSQFKVPAQVLMYFPSIGNFGVVQHLDVDRIISLTNLVISGDTFLAAATFTGKVRIYRLIQGQGFQVEQAFKYPGVKSITGYSIRNETFLAAATETRMAIFVARLRGFQKPSVKL